MYMNKKYENYTITDFQTPIFCFVIKNRSNSRPTPSHPATHRPISYQIVGKPT